MADTMTTPRIRWLIRSDMDEVMLIEECNFEHPWTLDCFLRALRQRNCIGMVATIDEKVVGFIVYELNKGRLEILNLAVLPSFQRRGIGRRIVERLIDKLSQQRRKEINVLVRERNIDAQLFFKALGFWAIKTQYGWYDDTDEDGYVFNFNADQGW